MKHLFSKKSNTSRKDVNGYMCPSYCTIVCDTVCSSGCGGVCSNHCGGTCNLGCAGSCADRCLAGGGVN